MSLTRIALRIAAVEALKGRTLVGANVLDSPNGALDVQADGTLRTEEEKPFVAIYTDQGRAENFSGRSLTENGACDIIFEMGVSSAMLHLDKDTGETSMVGINIPASDKASEFFLDVVQREIRDALTDPGNAWAEIYRGLHYRVLKIEFAGARNADDGQKLAGHQMRLTVELADDPVRGEGLDPRSPFLKFLEALEASGDEDYVKQAAMMRSLLSGGDEYRDLLQRRHGMTSAELDALGHEAPVLAEDGTVAEMTSVDIEIDGLSPVPVTES
ncbi:hypothetical protein ABID21_000662 [Pseudorhizobium tarimense]|uniref:Uncharacterized protein n=1 Tax=Pseudorhizobium tarimense TaxID=1079109 RepID=A0ABV2H2F3_9HYPH|nr:hypothetical protein [Pseudorhizobium tarimense]MCJ8517822.1 hypothetical protein [Pseudorhizobium tarimense]